MALKLDGTQCSGIKTEWQRSIASVYIFAGVLVWTSVGLPGSGVVCVSCEVDTGKLGGRLCCYQRDLRCASMRSTLLCGL